MSEHESQPALTRQLAAECDMLRLRSAAHERTEAELRREVDDLRERLNASQRYVSDANKTINDLREQVKQFKESLRLVGQLRRAEGNA